jgi:hypothetical protein
VACYPLPSLRLHVRDQDWGQIGPYVVAQGSTRKAQTGCATHSILRPRCYRRQLMQLRASSSMPVSSISATSSARSTCPLQVLQMLQTSTTLNPSPACILCSAHSDSGSSYTWASPVLHRPPVQLTLSLAIIFPSGAHMPACAVKATRHTSS